MPIELIDSSDVGELQAQIQFATIIKDSPEPEVLESNIKKSPDDLSSYHQLAAWRALEGQYETALILLLEIIKKDRTWQDDAGRKTMLTIFDLIPAETELVNKYRRQMFNLLH